MREWGHNMCAHCALFCEHLYHHHNISWHYVEWDFFFSNEAGRPETTHVASEMYSTRNPDPNSFFAQGSDCAVLDVTNITKNCFFKNKMHVFKVPKAKTS